MRRLTLARTLTAAAILASLALVADAQQVKPKEVTPSSRKPICRIIITPTGGMPASCVLLAYESGTYFVRHANGKEYALRATEVTAVKFMPLNKRKDESRSGEAKLPEDDRHKQPDDGRRPPRSSPFDVRGRWSERLMSIEPRLKDMKRKGTIGAYIKDHEKRLAECKDAIVARQLLQELTMAHRVNGWTPGLDYWRKLVQSINDEAVRQSLRLRPNPPPQGPRRPWRR